MYSRIYTAQPTDINSIYSYVECDTAAVPSYNRISLVGNLKSDVKEIGEYVFNALKNQGFDIDKWKKKITINIAPADIRKTGNQFDLPIVLGILKSFKYFEKFDLEFENTGAFGHVDSDGNIKSVKNAYSICESLKKNGKNFVILPEENYVECSSLFDNNFHCISVENLKNLVDEKLLTKAFTNNKNVHVNHKLIEKYVDDSKDFKKLGVDFAYDGFKDVFKNSKITKILTAFAISGLDFNIESNLNSAFYCANFVKEILPELSKKEKIELFKILSSAGKLNKIKNNIDNVSNNIEIVGGKNTENITEIVGGGVETKAGKMSFAHKGVLYLEETDQFSNAQLDIIRNCIEDRKFINIQRLYGTFKYPADYQLITSSLDSKTLKAINNDMSVKDIVNRLSHDKKINRTYFHIVNNLCIDNYVNKAYEPSKYSFNDIKKIVENGRKELGNSYEKRHKLKGEDKYNYLLKALALADERTKPNKEDIEICNDLFVNEGMGNIDNVLSKSCVSSKAIKEKYINKLEIKNNKNSKRKEKHHER